MKFYQLSYEYSDKVNHTIYYQSYDKAKLAFNKLINQVMVQNHKAKQFDWPSSNKITDWISVYDSDDQDATKLLDVCIMTMEMI